MEQYEGHHSPLPWSVREGQEDYEGQPKWNEIVDANGNSITDDAQYYPSAPGIYDMRFIVDAVNSYKAAQDGK